MTKNEFYKTALDTIIAVGTLLAVYVAVFGDKVRSWAHPLKLHLALNDGPGSMTRNGLLDRPVLWHHLKVTNKSETAAKHCRVMLVGIDRLADGRFVPVAFPVPFQLPWAPQELEERSATLVHTGIVDFGQLIPEPATLIYTTMRGGKRGEFLPVLYGMPTNFAGAVHAGETCRYALEVHAENLHRPPRFIFEVSWDGTWNPDAEVMRQHLKIRPVRAAELPS